VIQNSTMSAAAGSAATAGSAAAKESASESSISGWDRFWFWPSDSRALAGLRLATGALAFLYVLSFTDLTTWFGTQGILSEETVRLLRPESYRWSYLFRLGESTELWLIHFVGLAILATFTCGLFTRVTSVLSLIVVLSYIHRAPMLTGPLEPTLSMLLCYLAIGPCGQYWSVDAWLRKRKGAAVPTPSWLATVSRRLIQIHLAALYALMGLTKLGGQAGANDYDASWWRGEAVWWLISRSDSRLVDLTFLHSHPYLLNFWTHAIVAFELLFAVLIWKPQAARWLLVASVIIWSLTILVTGWVLFGLVMIVAGLVFLPRWNGQCVGETNA